MSKGPEDQFNRFPLVTPGIESDTPALPQPNADRRPFTQPHEQINAEEIDLACRSIWGITEQHGQTFKDACELETPLEYLLLPNIYGLGSQCDRYLEGLDVVVSFFKRPRPNQQFVIQLALNSHRSTAKRLMFRQYFKPEEPGSVNGWHTADVPQEMPYVTAGEAVMTHILLAQATGHGEGLALLTTRQLQEAAGRLGLY